MLDRVKKPTAADGVTRLGNGNALIEWSCAGQSSSRQRSAAAQASSGWAVRFASLTSRIADNRIDWSGLEFPGADSASAASLRTHGLAQYTGGRANPCLEWPDQLTARRRAS